MGRRSVAVNESNTLKARQMAATQLRTLLSRYDLAEFQAQTYAADMVDVLAGFARDPCQSVEFRRQCANDVLNRAYGMPATKATLTVIDPREQTPDGLTTVGAQIEAIKAGAAQLQTLDQYVGKRPVSEWPESIKALAGDMVTVFEEIEVPEGG